MKSGYDKAVELWRGFGIGDSRDLESHLKNFSVLFAYNSGAFGNPEITYHDAREIFDRGCVTGYTGSIETLRQIDNLKDVHMFLLRCFGERKPVSLGLICELHYEIVKGTGGESLGDFDPLDHLSPTSDVERGLEEDIEELLEIGRSMPLVSAAWFLARFEGAHVFKDGNGRTGRALVNHYLLCCGHPPIVFHVEDRREYRATLHEFGSKGDLKPLIGFMKGQTAKTWRASIRQHEASQWRNLGLDGKPLRPVRKYGLRGILESLEKGSGLTNKYKMSLQDNILFAKRNVVDSIWKEANIEGIGVTFPDTKEIFEGRTVAGLSVDDTVAINNLKHAWQFVLDNVEEPVDLAYVRQVHQAVGSRIVSNCGQLRLFHVSIGGTDWQPELPDPEKAAEAIMEIMAEEPGEERALHMFSYLCRAQLFYDGNKRTAQLVANKMLIADGAGILAIPAKHKRDFELLLVDYYETGDDSELLAFLDETSIDGVVPNPERERQTGDRDLKDKAVSLRELRLEGFLKDSQEDAELTKTDNDRDEWSR